MVIDGDRRRPKRKKYLLVNTKSLEKASIRIRLRAIYPFSPFFFSLFLSYKLVPYQVVSDGTGKIGSTWLQKLRLMEQKSVEYW